MKTFVVLGMHRSATSLVTKGLSGIINIGSVIMPAGRGNPWGHFENMRFVEMNDAILSAAGGSWDNPPQEEAILSLKNEFADRIQRLVKQESEGHELWGWKDPRTTLTIKLYLPYLINPHFIACFREPHEVALSLNKRDGFPIENGIRLAKEYNDRLLKFLTDWDSSTKL